MGRAVDMDSGKHGTVREMNALLDQLARQTEFVDVEDRSAPTKASLCARALVAGCPDAFINFHYLTTTGDGVGDDNPTEEELLARLVDPASYEEKEEVSAEHMPFVLESLVAAETHARSGDPAKTRDAYRALARFFIDTDNPMKAIFFHQKCLDAAVASGRAEDEMESIARSERRSSRRETSPTPSPRTNEDSTPRRGPNKWAPPRRTISPTRARACRARTTPRRSGAGRRGTPTDPSRF